MSCQTRKTKEKMQTKHNKIKDIKIPILNQRPLFDSNTQNAVTGDIKATKVSSPNTIAQIKENKISKGKNSSLVLTAISKNIKLTIETNKEMIRNTIRYIFFLILIAKKNIRTVTINNGAMIGAKMRNIPTIIPKRYNNHDIISIILLISCEIVENYPDILRTSNIISQIKKPELIQQKSIVETANKYNGFGGNEE